MPPALTLQELRDVVRWNNMIHDLIDADRFLSLVMEKTAPDLADWVIARLEEGR